MMPAVSVPSISRIIFSWAKYNSAASIGVLDAADDHFFMNIQKPYLASLLRPQMHIPTFILPGKNCW